MKDLKLNRDRECWRGSFTAMASPCEVLMEIDDRKLAQQLLEVVAEETRRIEYKYSRYRDDNVIASINSANGKSVEVDDETARLFDFADQLYQMSDGMFDITSGVLRHAWRFDGSDRLPDESTINRFLDLVGWQRVEWQENQIRLESKMEIDFGGLGKEYAVDRCIQKVCELTRQSVLVNLGGDLAVSQPRKNRKYWSVGRQVTGKAQATNLFQLFRGAIATSGDANRFLLKDGKRYSHVLNPKTGWPVEAAPHTVSVAADTCTEAGMFSTLAMLQGDQAETFLALQSLSYWID